jgi:hypothetical protein
MLFYNVIDIATTNKKQAVYNIFSKKEIKHYISEYKSHVNIVTEVSSITKGILKVIDWVFKEKKILVF